VPSTTTTSIKKDSRKSDFYDALSEDLFVVQSSSTKALTDESKSEILTTFGALKSIINVQQASKQASES